MASLTFREPSWIGGRRPVIHAVLAMLALLLYLPALPPAQAADEVRQSTDNGQDSPLSTGEGNRSASSGGIVREDLPLPPGALSPIPSALPRAGNPALAPSRQTRTATASRSSSFLEDVPWWAYGGAVLVLLVVVAVVIMRVRRGKKKVETELDLPVTFD